MAAQHITALTCKRWDEYRELKRREKRQFFGVTSINSLDLLEQIKAALAKILEAGETERIFAKEIDVILAKSGLPNVGRKDVADLFQDYCMLAYAKEHYRNMRDPAVIVALPFWKWSTAGDGRVRPAHAALDGFVARWDDPVWEEIFPPLESGCRCTVVAILEQEAPLGANSPGRLRLPHMVAKLLRGSE